jgi:uncharacterized protein YbjT (DUF2867 family)
MGSDVVYDVKKRAMIVLCVGFTSAARTETNRYLERGIADVISLAIACTDDDLHVAAAALAEPGAFGELTGDAELVLMATDACERHIDAESLREAATPHEMGPTQPRHF